MYRPMDGCFSVLSGSLPGGDAGTRKTLDNMRQLADQGSRDLTVRAAAVRAIRSSGAPSHDIPAQVDAIFTFVRDTIYFLNDPAGTEWLQSPRATLSFGVGDCDDRATLLAAMLRTIGVTTQFRVIAADPRRPATFSHVYVVANVRGRAVPLDPTYQDNVMGFELPRPFRVATVPA